MLISLILTLTVMATLGAAMIYMTSSSGYGFLTATSHQKAYYLAYSGLTYYDAQPVKPTLPQTYRLASGDRFVLDVEGVPERLTSTGVVSGPFGDIRVKLSARSSGGSPEWVDTMDDTDNWLADERTAGSLDTEVVDDNAALRTEGESFDLPGAGGPVSLQTAIDDTTAIRDDYISRRASSAPLSLEFFRNDFYARYWSAVVGALEDALAILIGAGVTDDTVTLPSELSQPRVFGVFDWRTVNDGSAIPFFDYWNSTVYDGVPHDLNSLSYDLQVKTAVIPNSDDYLSGLSLRLDNGPANGGNLLGLSIVRGRRGNTLPDRLIPQDDAATPAIILWAQQDRNGDGLITPLWEYTIPPAGPTLTLWPEEREVLAYAELPLNYCLLQGISRYFEPWLTLLVRLDERSVRADEAGGAFAAGERVNAIKVYLSTPFLCNGGGSISGAAPDFLLDNRRGPNQRLAPLSAFINWPVFDRNNFRVTNDNFNLVGGSAVQVAWTFVSSSPSATLGFRVEQTGRSTEWENDAVILTDAFTTEGYSSDVDSWPEELGLHAMGLFPSDPGTVFFDDFAVRLKGRDPVLR
ncbi:MAG: hypothetical protein PVJ53_14200 [Desulfobacterales bacterium]